MLDFISNPDKRNRFIFDTVLLLLAALLATLPIIINGIPESRDIPQHLQFAQTFYDSLSQGNFSPGWAAQSNSGYGDVGVRFYPPLTYYSVSFLRFLAGNWYDAFVLFIFVFYFLSGFGLYLWARENFSVNSSLFGALIYVFLPYHIMQIYVGAVFSEFAAAAMLPFCFLFIDKTLEKGRTTDICNLGLCYGLLLLTHLPTALIGSIVFLIYSLLSWKKTSAITGLIKLAVSVGIALLLSSFYWVRMISEIAWVQHSGEAFSSGEYYYRNRFIFSFWLDIPQVIDSSRSSLMETNALITFGIIIPFLFIYRLKSKASRLKSAGSVIFFTLFAIFMTLPLSIPVWEVFPFLQKVQFPFRWLTIVSLGAAFTAAAGFETVVEIAASSRRYLSILALGACLISLPYVYFRMMNTVLVLPKDYFNRVADSFKTLPSCECWWSVWAVSDKSQKNKSGTPKLKYLPEKIVASGRTFTIEKWESLERGFAIEPGAAGRVQIATMYYPHWQAVVNGQPVEVSPSETGLISFIVPSEASQITLFFQEPSYIGNFLYLSVFSWLTLLLLMTISFCRERNGE